MTTPFWRAVLTLTVVFLLYCAYRIARRARP